MSDEEEMLTVRVPARATRCDCGFALGKWHVWAVIDSRWYSGRQPSLEDANNEMLDNYRNGRHLGVIKQIQAKHRPDAKTRSTTPVPETKLSEMF